MNDRGDVEFVILLLVCGALVTVLIVLVMMGFAGALEEGAPLC